MTTDTATDTTRVIINSYGPGTYVITYGPNPDIPHRLNGPAHVSTRPTTSLQWWTEGELHRVDGPTYTPSDGDIFWTVESNDITQASEPRGHD